MTRNSPLWWLGISAGIVAILSDDSFNLLHQALPIAWHGKAEAWIRITALITGLLSAFFRMSVLALSPDSTLAGTADPSKTLSILPSRKD